MWRLLPWYFKVLIILAVLAAVAFAVHTYNESLRQDGRDEKQAQWTADNLRLEKIATEAREKNAKEGIRRSEAQALNEKRKIDELAKLSSDVDRLTGELRNRPSRPVAGGAAPADPTAATSCTGAGLFVQDADFLVREAARAKRVLIERDSCHDKYDSLTPK